MVTRPSPQFLELGDAVAISSLCRRTGASRHQVELLYAEEMAALLAAAKVKNFVPLIANRRVRDRLSAARKTATPLGSVPHPS